MLGNGMVLLVYCRKRNKLRPPELMTINLAVCDLGFSLLGVPFFITSRYQDGFRNTARFPLAVSVLVFSLLSVVLSRLTFVSFRQPVSRLGVWRDAVPLVRRPRLCVRHRLPPHHLSHLGGTLPEDLQPKIWQVAPS